jgi:hypothetical protein
VITLNYLLVSSGRLSGSARLFPFFRGCHHVLNHRHPGRAHFCSARFPFQAVPRRASAGRRVMTVGLGGIRSGSSSQAVCARVRSRLGFRGRQAGASRRRAGPGGSGANSVQDYRLAADAARAQVAAAVTNRDLAAADFKRFRELRDQNFISGAELAGGPAQTAQAQLEGPGPAQWPGQSGGYHWWPCLGVVTPCGGGRAGGGGRCRWYRSPRTATRWCSRCRKTGARMAVGSPSVRAWATSSASAGAAVGPAPTR